MFKCYITGVLIDRNNAYLIDFNEARKALTDLRDQIESINNLIERFNVLDEIEIEDWQTSKIERKKVHRFVCRRLADVINQNHINHRLFISFKEFMERRKKRKNKKGGGYV